MVAKMKAPKYPKVIIKHEMGGWYKGYWHTDRGGQCTVFICMDDGVAVTGQAQCSFKDMYSRNKGKSIALGRACRAVSLLADFDMVDRVLKAINEDHVGKVSYRLFYAALWGKQIR